MVKDPQLDTSAPGGVELDVQTRTSESGRIGPGGAPELLAVGEMEATSVVIPAMYIFNPGSLYQLFVKGRNGAGAGEASPSVSWTA